MKSYVDNGNPQISTTEEEGSPHDGTGASLDAETEGVFENEDFWI